MSGHTNDGPVVSRVRALVAPIVDDLHLDLYDVEQRGSTLRITVDTPAGSPSGIDLDQLALVTRLVSRALDHDDPVPGRYTLEVTSPGLERTLRTPAHFCREVGKTVSIRLSDVVNDERRLRGVLVAADDEAATIRVDDGAQGEPIDRVVPYHQIDRARTVFEWGPAPKPGSASRARSTTRAGSKPGPAATTTAHATRARTRKEDDAR